jgi:hypothetical protein
MKLRFQFSVLFLSFSLKGWEKISKIEVEQFSVLSLSLNNILSEQ